MPNFQTTGIPGAIYNLLVTPTQVIMNTIGFTPAGSATYPNLDAALSDIRDNWQPCYANADANAGYGGPNGYLFQILWHANNTGPWSEQGAGLPGAYNG